jgi:hypothetical protein
MIEVSPDWAMPDLVGHWGWEELLLDANEKALRTITRFLS